MFLSFPTSFPFTLYRRHVKMQKLTKRQCWPATAGHHFMCEYWNVPTVVNSELKTFLLVRFPAPMPFYSHLSGTPEASQPTFRRFLHWRTVVVFIGHLIRQWAHSMSCRSTSKATWQHSIKMTRRDMPGSCGTASSGQKSGWTAVFWTMTLMISPKI